MRHPVICKLRFFSVRRLGWIALSLASVFILAGPVPGQSLEKFTIKSDRNKPLEAPKKATSPAKSQNNKSQSDSQDAIFGPLSGCVYNDILVLDTIRIVFVQLFNFPENSAIPVTVTQTTEGVVGYALTPAGPFTPTLNIVVNTDGNGNGESAPVYTQGQIVGTTVSYGETSFGTTTTITFNVLPQCNCPQIPVVP
jgi:hypothetical protein